MWQVQTATVTATWPVTSNQQFAVFVDVASRSFVVPLLVLTKFSSRCLR